MVHTIIAATMAAWVMPFVIRLPKRNIKCLANDIYRIKVDRICKLKITSLFDLQLKTTTAKILSLFLFLFCIPFRFRFDLSYDGKFFFFSLFSSFSLVAVIFHNRHRMLALYNHNSLICQSNMNLNRIQCIIHWLQILMVPLAVCQS